MSDETTTKATKAARERSARTALRLRWVEGSATAAAAAAEEAVRLAARAESDPRTPWAWADAVSAGTAARNARTFATLAAETARTVRAHPAAKAWAETLARLAEGDAERAARAHARAVAAADGPA